MRLISIVCAMLLLLTSAADTEKRRHTRAKSDIAPTQGGMIAVVDPVSRRVRQATPAEIGALSPPVAVPAQPGVPPVTIQGPGGAVGLVLGPQYQTYILATKTTDGNIRMEESSGDPQLRHEH